MVQADQEQATQNLLIQCNKFNPWISIRVSPKYSPQSLGAVERWHTQLYAQLRALREHMEKIQTRWIER